jgi:putative drug exporter of the RND superfamily
VTALQRPEAELPTVANVTSVIPVAAVRGVDVIQVTPGTSPEAKATSDLISTLRDDIILAAERGTTLRVYIGGVPATLRTSPPWSTPSCHGSSSPSSV